MGSMLPYIYIAYMDPMGYTLHYQPATYHEKGCYYLLLLLLLTNDRGRSIYEIHQR